jgi:hypothetical protein
MFGFQKEGGSLGMIAVSIVLWFTHGDVNDMILVYGFLIISITSTFLVVSSLSRFYFNMKKYGAVFQEERKRNAILLARYQS